MNCLWHIALLRVQLGERLAYNLLIIVVAAQGTVGGIEERGLRLGNPRFLQDKFIDQVLL